MQNTTFLVILRPNFALKIKAAPPMGLGSRSCKGLAVIWTTKVEFFSGAQRNLVRTSARSLVKTFFLFLRSPDLRRKNCFNFGEDFFLRSRDYSRKNSFNFDKDVFFFGDHLILTEKPPQSDSGLMKIWVKFVYCCFRISKKPPPSPFAKSWLRA